MFCGECFKLSEVKTIIGITGSKSKNNKEYLEYIDKWKKGLISGFNDGKYKNTSKHIRKFLFEKYDSKCSNCGWSELNKYSNTIPLQLEHIDGNSKNCSESNLDLLCPNCHSLTSTYMGLNRGNGRKHRYGK